MAPQHVPRIVAVALLGCLALFFMIASLNTAARSTFAQGSAKVSLFDRYERHSLKTENEALKAQLENMKAKSRLVEWKGGSSALDGEEVSVSDVEFTVDGEKIAVHDVKPVKKNGDFFLRHIAKQNELMEDLGPAKPLVYKGKPVASA